MDFSLPKQISLAAIKSAPSTQNRSQKTLIVKIWFIVKVLLVTTRQQRVNLLDFYHNSNHDIDVFI